MPNNEFHPYIALIWDLITLEFMIKFAVIYFFVVWIALVIWVSRDISVKTNSKIYQIFCVLIMILFTPLGIFLYLLVRPRKSIYEKYSQEIEGNLEILDEIVHDKLMQEKLEKAKLKCPECREEIQKDFTICPSCKYNLKHVCDSCHKEIREWWKVCPFCQTKQKSKKKKKTD